MSEHSIEKKREFIFRLLRAWTQMYTKRLGELIFNISRGGRVDIFHMENDKLIELIEENVQNSSWIDGPVVTSEANLLFNILNVWTKEINTEKRFGYFIHSIYLIGHNYPGLQQIDNEKLLEALKTL